MLEEYSDIAAGTESKAFRYLVNLLIEDEIRHHRIFADLAESVETIALMKAKEPAVPFIDFVPADRNVVLERTERLLEHEIEDARFKRLRRELRNTKDESLKGLLVELMQRDTEKHIAILRFVRMRTRRRRY